jgi:hypothetical protein
MHAHPKLDWENIRNVKKHWFVVFLHGFGVIKARTTALDLHTTACFRLDVLDVGATGANNLSTEVEAGNRLEVNGYLLLGPLALQRS